jgi:hypothetical protein
VKSSAAGTLSSITPSKTCYNLGVEDEVTLVTDAGYSNYIWTIPAGWTITSTTSNTNTIKVKTNGTTGTVSVKGVNECATTAAKTITLTATGIGQPVTITKTSVTGADILNAPNYTNLGATYEWFKNGSPTPIAGATGFVLQLPNAGTLNNTYCVVITLNSCKTGGVCSSSTYNNARIADPTESLGMTAHPNPVDQNVTVTIQNPDESEALINVYQQGTGAKLKSVTTTGASYTFDTAAWASGLYVIEAIVGTERKTTSVVVEH